MRLSIIVPVLDEEACIGHTLASVRSELRHDDELLVADGGSSDRTRRIAEAGGAAVLDCERGRGLQMNAAAERASGDVLLFLHADTRLPHGYREALDTLLRDDGVRWGRFDIDFDEGGVLLKLIARLISGRSRIFRSATGDQAIFVRRADFTAVGGYREATLFEDVDLARRLRARGRMGIPNGRAVTSSRRWRNRGVWWTTARMWTLKTLYLCGVPAERLARHYPDER
jgi:rSAM/selenodomain-associated transferase 2